jgi:putative transposase
MTNSTHNHHRRSIRFQGYDYASEGGYFVTIVTYKRQNLFGDVVDGELRLNEFGRIVMKEWFKTDNIRDDIELIEDEFVVMPNHIHGIIWIIGDKHQNLGDSSIIESPNVGAYRDTPLQSPSQTIGAMMRGFKGAVTTRINTHRHVKGQPVWQRNYYEHIIRDDKDYQAIAEYIDLNPVSWENDIENN